MLLFELILPLLFHIFCDLYCLICVVIYICVLSCLNKGLMILITVMMMDVTVVPSDCRDRIIKYGSSSLKDWLLLLETDYSEVI